MANKNTYDFTQDFNKLADEYLATCGREQTRLPKIKDFCRQYLGVDYDTVNQWLNGEKLPERVDISQLSGAIKKIKDAQESELIDDGFFGGKEVNSPMAIFLLKANHGYIETNRNELVGKDGQPLQISIKLDMAGGYVPQLGAFIAASTTGNSGSSPIQDTGMASKSEKNDNSINGDSKTGSV